MQHTYRDYLIRKGPAMDDTLREKLITVLRSYLDACGDCHSVDHTLRVRNLAIYLAQFHPGIDRDLLEAAAYLHDIGRGVPDGRSHAKISAELAQKHLNEMGFSPDDVRLVRTAIEEHPFSGGTTPSHLLGQILQDADRLDALGAIGIARVFMYSTTRPLYDMEDPFAALRELDDDRYTLDHFYVKLLKLPETLHTDEARTIARSRAEFMNQYLQEFAGELDLVKSHHQADP